MKKLIYRLFPKHCCNECEHYRPETHYEDRKRQCEFAHCMAKLRPAGLAKVCPEEEAEPKGLYCETVRNFQILPWCWKFKRL